ncbi:MAG: helix-turn-helix domain-containing protein [Spirochaetaceae bacterium]
MEQVPPFQIGRNIQEIRRKKNMTLGHLSTRCGVSKAMLSQIETDKTNPTVATVWKIAEGLHVDIETLLKIDGEPERKFNVSRKDDITVIDTEDSGIHIQVLSPFSLVEDLEIYTLTFEPGGRLESSPHFSRTEEFLTIIEGEVDVRAGSQQALLRAGDFINYHCDCEHSIRNTHGGISMVHMIVRFNEA